jgi:hypothetical protein
MDKLPDLDRLSASEKDALIAALWAEVQCLKARLAVLGVNTQEPRKAAHHSSVPPSQTPKLTCSSGPCTEKHREASLARAGGGRPLHPEPQQVIITHTKICPYDGGPMQAHEQHPHAVYDKKSSCPRSNPWAPGWSSVPGSVRTVGGRMWPRFRWDWNLAHPLGPRSRGWRLTYVTRT